MTTDRTADTCVDRASGNSPTQVGWEISQPAWVVKLASLHTGRFKGFRSTRRPNVTIS